MSSRSGVMMSPDGAGTVGRKDRFNGIFDDGAIGVLDNGAIGVLDIASIGMSYEMIFRGGFAGSVYNFACSMAIASVYQESSTFK